jgi:hypothetical protein
MIRRVCVVASVVACLIGTAAGAPKKKYFLDLATVTAKPDVDAETAKAATPRIEAQLRATFASDPQLVAKLDGAPDWKADAAAYRKHLAKHGVSAAYFVTVDVTEATEKLEPIDGTTKSQRLVVRVAIHMLGEAIPGRTMGFTGDGHATIKVEVGKKVSERDRQYAWDEAAKAAIGDAMKTVFKQLAVPPKKP